MSKGKCCFSNTSRNFFLFSLSLSPPHVMPSWRIFATLGKYFSVNSNGKELITSEEGYCCLFIRLLCKPDESGIPVCAQCWAFCTESRITVAFTRFSYLEEKGIALLLLSRQSFLFFAWCSAPDCRDKLELALETLNSKWSLSLIHPS